VIGVLEGLIGWIEAEATPLFNLLFTQTLVQRLGGPSVLPFNASFLEALEAGAAQGSSFAELLAQPEQDTYRYPAYTGSHAGGAATSLVCNAYACGLHKAAGTFGALGAEINCADTHNAVRGARARRPARWPAHRAFSPPSRRTYTRRLSHLAHARRTSTK
jgi:hypothetical protein